MIRIGISACVLGKPVRFDGGHKRSNFVVSELTRHFEFHPICPEQAIGMGTPRPTIRLVGDPESPAVKGSQDPSLDVTKALSDFSNESVRLLPGIAGYILCAKSPTCGMERVPVYGKDGMRKGKLGVGVFARALMHAHPNLPVEEDGRLNDPLLRENFVMRVTAYNQWLLLCQKGVTPAELQNYHRQHKFLLLAHHPDIYRRLGPAVASATVTNIEEVAASYISRFMTALKKPANRKNHTNVLMHMQGFFKKQLLPQERQELAELINQYRVGYAPLMAPLTLMKHFLNRHPDEYLKQQSYLSPYPEDLKLRYGL